MKKEFVSYETALELKELGFNEPCYGYYIELKNPKEGILEIGQIEKETIGINAPLYQQAFRWFREKCNVSHYVSQDWDSVKNLGYDGQIESLDGEININTETFAAYEEAEIECLKQLIKIAKQKL